MRPTAGLVGQVGRDRVLPYRLPARPALQVAAIHHVAAHRGRLTVLTTAGQADLHEFFAQHRVEVVASLPHYRATNTDRQRGDGVYEKSIAALKRLNEVGLMCRNTLSVGWDGLLYDCDFNQMLGLGVGAAASRHIRDFDPAALAGRSIVVGRPCFGCTAGAGSSCGGSLAS